ncbi:MAG: hypothetical protein SVP52_01785, partial [Chloroflexota bacterium]|nr:hypothetical protein [Chloroflexota bacterium]
RPHIMLCSFGMRLFAVNPTINLQKYVVSFTVQSDVIIAFGKTIQTKEKKCLKKKKINLRQELRNI